MKKLKNSAKILLIIIFVIAAMAGAYLIYDRVKQVEIVDLSSVSETVSSSVNVDDLQIENNIKPQMQYFDNQSSEKLLIFLHGAGGPDGKRAEDASSLMNVLAPTYELNALLSYPFEDQKVYDVVDTSMEEAFSRGFEEEEIIVMGFSLGGAQAVYAAVNYPNIQKVILIGTFTTVKSACSAITSESICALIPDDYLDTEAIAGDSKSAIHQYHSEDDKVVAFSDGQALFEILGSQDKEFTIITGGHNDFNIVQILNENL